MADQDSANLNEIKRLLRRLDKTHFSTALPVPVASPAPVHTATATTVPKATAVRTVVLAGLVSLIVSLSVVVLLLNDAPIRPFVKGAEPPLAPGQAAPVQGKPAIVSAETPAAAPPQTQTQTPPIAAADASSVGAVASTAAKQEIIVAAPTEPPTAAEPPPPATAEQPSAPAIASVPPLPSDAATTQPAAQTDTAQAALVELDASQFLRRGLTMLSRGNVNAAQLLLERAADLGNGEAAFALASTYDGAAGAPRQGADVRPNAELALRWYARASELGVDAAGKRLQNLNAGR